MTKNSGTHNDIIEFLTYDAAFVSAKDEVDRVLSTSPLLIRTYTAHLMTSNGKFIRAISLLTCAQNQDGLIHPDAVHFAAAIELLHLATLVHDDVIDNAKTRRGSITLQKKYGKRTAVICGDYLLCAALKTASNVADKKNYIDLDIADYVSRICLGELSQHINNGNLDLSVYQYLRIISGKTAMLFEASFYAGAILCTEDERSIRRYMRLGRYIGMIFQLTDDCIDFEMDETVAKKPVQSDFEQGVITLPLIYALKNKLGFKEKAQSGRISRAEINDAVSASGGLTYTHLISKRYYDKALLLIAELDMAEDKRNRLMFILDKAYYGLNYIQKV